MEEKTKYQFRAKFKKGEEVKVIKGKCRGEIGKIEKIDYKTNKVFITGVNIYKRHTKPSMAHQEGGIIDKVMPLPIANVMLLDPKKKKPTRVGYKTEAGKKVRVLKASGTVLS